MANLISEHEIRIYEAVRENGGWLTCKQIAAAADVANRTSRGHCQSLADVGLFEVSKVFGGYRYRLAHDLNDRAREYLAQIDVAKRVMR